MASGVSSHGPSVPLSCSVAEFFYNDPASTGAYPLSLHDALPICCHRLSSRRCSRAPESGHPAPAVQIQRSEEHTSELQSLRQLVCRLLLEKKKTHPAPACMCGTRSPGPGCCCRRRDLNLRTRPVS